jgi:His-Xaa-Ser system protein HxsD
MTEATGETAQGVAEAVPADLVQVEVGARSVALRIDGAAHPVASVYGAAYLFLDRCWVLLDRPDPAHVRVTLTPRSAKTPLDGDALAAEFAEELVSSTFRAAIAQQTRATIDAAITRAHAGGDVPPTLDDLATYDFDKSAKEP